MFSTLAFYSDDLSSNPTWDYKFSVKLLLKRKQTKWSLGFAHLKINKLFLKNPFTWISYPGKFCIRLSVRRNSFRTFFRKEATRTLYKGTSRRPIGSRPSTLASWPAEDRWVAFFLSGSLLPAPNLGMPKGIWESATTHRLWVGTRAVVVM